MRCLLRWFAVIAVLGMFLGIRLWAFGADPPRHMPNGRSTLELIVEPLAKAHEARNWALFGSFSTNPVDNYQFWRPQAPAWVYPVAGWFRLFGVSTRTLGAFALTGAALGFVAYLALARQRLRGFPWLAAALLLGLNFYQILYSRVGLLEIQVVGLVTLSSFAFLLAERRPMFLCLAMAAFVAAFFTKQSAAFFFPVAAAAYVRRQWMLLGERDRSWAYRLAPIFVAVALGAGAVLVIRSPEYMRTLAWNFGHVVMGETQHQEIAVEKVPLLDVLLRPLTWARWKAGYFLLFPVAGGLALLRAVSLLPAIVRRRIGGWEALVLGSFVCALAATLLSKPEGSRFELILYVPVALLAASAIGALWSVRGRLWLRIALRVPAVLVVLGALSFDAYYYAQWAKEPAYSMRDLRREAARVIAENPATWAGHPPKPAVVIGLWAAPLVFDTEHVYYYTKENFNASKPALIALQPTHMFLFDRWDPTRGIMTYHFPSRMKDLEKLQTWKTPRGEIAFLALDGPLP